jgi:cupin superfamily acireductone dioxygenase involved in methionine salvage
MSLPQQIEQVFAMPTVNGARALRRFQPPRRWVVKGGRVIAETSLSRTISITGSQHLHSGGK